MRGISVTLMTLDAQGVWKDTTVDNVLVAPVMEVDSNQAIVQLGHRAVYHLAIPKDDTNVWEGQLVQFFGCTWSVVGIPTKGIDHLIPGPWNQKVTVELYRNATPTGQSLWLDTISFPTASIVQDDDGYNTKSDGTPVEVKVIFVAGVDEEWSAEGDKAGMRRKASVEIWAGNYDGQTQLEHDGILYNVTKVTNTGRGSLLLSLEEVWR